MSNIHVKVTIEDKNWRSQNFDFLGLKNLSQCQFWGAPTHADIIKFWNFFLQLRNQRSRSKNMCGFFIIFILKGIRRFKVKESMHFVEQKYKL